MDLGDTDKIDFQSTKEYYCVRECVFNKNYWYQDRFYMEREFYSGLTKGLDKITLMPKYMVNEEGPITPIQRRLMDTRIDEIEGDILNLKLQMQSGHVRGGEDALKKMEILLTRLKKISKKLRPEEYQELKGVVEFKRVEKPEDNMPALTEVQREQIYKEMQVEKTKAGKLKTKSA